MTPKVTLFSLMQKYQVYNKLLIRMVLPCPVIFFTASKPQPSISAPDEYLISPITGEKIPASKMQEHMRIGLLDPRWLEQRDRCIRERQTEDEVYAPGLDIESSLKQLAERRTDIFGVEETAIGKKIGEEEIQKPEEKVRTWL